MISNLTSYKTIIFDCDGVILNSNKVKTQAFYDLAFFKITKLCVNNGGISRHKKISYLLSTILPSLSINISSEESQFLYAIFSSNTQILSIRDYLHVKSLHLKASSRTYTAFKYCIWRRSS